MQARAVFEAQPEGNYVFIKGSSADPNADFLFSGQMEVLQEAIDAGTIKNVGEAYTDGWLPANAQRNMEQFLTANNNEVDAVVASNDGTAGGAIAALEAQGLAGSFRSRARTATMPRSTASRSARRPSRSGRMRANSARTRRRSPTSSPKARRWRTSRARRSGPTARTASR